jgi:uncharacterized protein Veg
MPDDAATAYTIDRVKADLASLRGKDVVVSCDKGRSKFTQDNGIMDNVYPATFTVRIRKRRGRFLVVSYSYADIISGKVTVTAV